MNKSEKFDESLQELARFHKAFSHPARLAILKYLAETKTCISGDFSDNLPLSLTTVSQHLKELKETKLIHSTVDRPRVNYCLCNSNIKKYLLMLESFFKPIRTQDIICNAGHKHESNLTEIPSTNRNYQYEIC